MSKIIEIENFINGSPNRLRESYFSKYNEMLYFEITKYTELLDLSFKQRIWHWVYNKPNYIYCEHCNINRVSFNMNWKDGYKKYCSNKCSSNSKEFKSKSKETLLKKYGVDHYSKTEEYTNKVKKTSLEKWGVDNFSKTEEFKLKSKETYLKKWGVDCYTKTREYKEKSRETYLKNWGVEHYSRTSEFKEKFKLKSIEKWGVDHPYKSDFFRDKFKITKEEGYIGYENGLNIIECEKGHIYEIDTDNFYGRTKNNIPLCTVCNPIGDSQSIKEIELLDYIKSIYSGEIISSYRDLMEIDIYLPELNLGFEFNGLWWHSEKYKDKNYHLNKTNFFKEKGIRIIHIWEDDWTFNNKIIKSQIKNWLGLTTNKIFARNCKIIELDDVSNFLNNNHIQGSDRSIIKIALINKNEIASVMTFNKSEGRKKMNECEWNLSRFCNKIDTTVIGGANKLLNYFIKNYNPKRIISYADKDWSIGDLYHKLGFKNIKESGPDYKYLFKNKRTHKQNFTKSRLKIKDITESIYMSKNEIYKIWDCGKIKFEIKNPS